MMEIGREFVTVITFCLIGITIITTNNSASCSACLSMMNSGSIASIPSEALLANASSPVSLGTVEIKKQ